MLFVCISNVLYVFLKVEKLTREKRDVRVVQNITWNSKNITIYSTKCSFKTYFTDKPKNNFITVTSRLNIFALIQTAVTFKKITKILIFSY